MLTTISAWLTAWRNDAWVRMRATSRAPVRLSWVERFSAETAWPAAASILLASKSVKLAHPPQSSWPNGMESPIVTIRQPGLAVADVVASADEEGGSVPWDAHAASSDRAAAATAVRTPGLMRR